MKPEEFEVYVIPPNFMEGGTLFGGLFKTRNTIEAVILGLAVGVPVLHLPFSLTVRVVILCLTALPLVLLALIGVSGMSLSAFIRLFFCFLHNRRILSRDGTQGGKNGKTLLPSWAQQRKSDCEAEDPPLPKSRSRFSVDLKQRSVTQFKTFLQEEEAVQPLNALTDYIPIEKIEHGVIYTRNHRYVILTQPDAHSYFLLDGSFPHFYYLTNDRYGEAILRLLCDTQQRRTLDVILADGLHEGIPNWRVENDAIDSEGNPVLFAYTCDFPRIRRFDTALELHGMTGTLICFDYQEEALREICGQCVMLQSIDFQQFERSVLYS